MQLRERIILNSEIAEVNSNYTSAVEASRLELERLGMLRVLRNEKVKAISTLIIRTRFARSSKAYTTFTSWKNATCSNTFFFLASRLCSRGPVLYFDWANVIVAACFTLRGHDTLTVNPLLSPPEGLFISSPFEGGLIETWGLFNLKNDNGISSP